MSFFYLSNETQITVKLILSYNYFKFNLSKSYLCILLRRHLATGSDDSNNFLTVPSADVDNSKIPEGRAYTLQL